MSFLPDNYEAPKSKNNYMKLQEGENRIRILSQPILGWEDWLDKKPVRFHFNEKPKTSFDSAKPVKHFWAFVVWNCAEEQIQVLQLTQSSIRSSIEALCKDADWGAPYFYDIKIVKSGDGVETKYAVNPVPHKALDKSIIQAFYEKPCYLDALFTNQDPFAADWESTTGLAIEKMTQESFDMDKHTVAAKDITELKEMLEQCDPEYQKQLLQTLKKMKEPILKIDDIPQNLFEKIKDAVARKRDEYQESLQLTEVI